MHQNTQQPAVAALSQRCAKGKVHPKIPSETRSCFSSSGQLKELRPQITFPQFPQYNEGEIKLLDVSFFITAALQCMCFAAFQLSLTSSRELLVFRERFTYYTVRPWRMGVESAPPKATGLPTTSRMLDSEFDIQNLKHLRASLHEHTSGTAPW